MQVLGEAALHRETLLPLEALRVVHGVHLDLVPLEMMTFPECLTNFLPPSAEAVLVPIPSLLASALSVAVRTASRVALKVPH